MSDRSMRFAMLAPGHWIVWADKLRLIGEEGFL